MKIFGRSRSFSLPVDEEADEEAVEAGDDAASVAVNAPVRMPPTTRTGASSAGHTFTVARATRGS